MGEFLAWLYSIASRVGYWFSTMWATAVDVILHAWAWASDKANQAYASAVNWAARAIADAKAGFKTFFDEAKAYASSLYWTVRNWAAGEFEAAKGLINNAINTAKDYASGLYNSARNWALVEIAVAKGVVLAVLDGKISLWNNQFNPLLPLTGRVGSILSITEPTFLSKLADLIAHGYQNLSAFASDPIGVTAASLWPIFESMFCNAIARGLGTVKYDLPPMPSWSTAHGGGTYDGEIPAGETGLVRPLSSMFISGYIYNPATSHFGVDYGLTRGEPVMSAHDGIVLAVLPGSSGYGNHVIIQSGEYWSLYGHLQSFNVAAGQGVKAGQVIGYGNSTGNSTGDHLHFELKVKGSYVNPVSWLP